MALSQKADSFGKERICVQKLEKLGDDPKQAIDQLDLGENVALFCPFHRAHFNLLQKGSKLQEAVK